MLKFMKSFPSCSNKDPLLPIIKELQRAEAMRVANLGSYADEAERILGGFTPEQSKALCDQMRAAFNKH